MLNDKNIIYYYIYKFIPIPEIIKPKKDLDIREA